MQSCGEYSSERDWPPTPQADQSDAKPERYASTKSEIGSRSGVLERRRAEYAE